MLFIRKNVTRFKKNLLFLALIYTKLVVWLTFDYFFFYDNLDFQTNFRLNALNESAITLITISFKTENDMATWNSQVDAEREILTQKVFY